MSDIDKEALFFEVFEELPRQGPGNLECARRALQLCVDLPSQPNVLDLGCGTGGQTLHLAERLITDGRILAVDSHAPSIVRLRATVKDRGLEDRITARSGKFEELDFENASFDLVWSEGALYNMGMDAALPFCARLLRQGGYLAFTEAVWRSSGDDVPSEVREAFADYGTMGTVERIVSLVEDSEELNLVGHFPLPDQAWWDDFYDPMESRIKELRGKYADRPEALALLDQLGAEPAMHRRHASYYGYEFIVCQRL